MNTIKLAQRGAGAALAMSILIPASRLPATPFCPFRMLTGWPCPGCGLTHAFCDISHGNFRMAWQANPFGFLFYALAIVLLVWPWLRTRFPFIDPAVSRTRAAVWAPALLIVGMWVYDLARIAKL